MEINKPVNNLDSILNKVDADKAAARPPKAAPAAGARESGDVVSFSTSALKRVVVDAAMAAPDVRADKVAELKAAVESGSYQADSRSIAEGMVREEIDLA